jgi:hypothetical protein
MDEKEFPSFINSTSDDDEILENMLIKHKHSGEHKTVELMDETTDKIGAGDLQNHYNNLNHVVSPSQLQTRLEILRRESQLECSSKNSSGSGTSSSTGSKKKKDKSSLHSKCCLCCSCAIL